MTAEQEISTAGFGPYTVLDLHELPEDGKGFELEDGWLIEVAAGGRHNWTGRRLARIIEAAAVGRPVVVLDGGEWEVSTPAGVRKPDVFVVPSEVARASIVDASPRLIPGTEILLVVEVISPGSGSERTDRVRKVREYAALGIPQYWMVEPNPAVRIHRAELDEASYRWSPVVTEGNEFAAEIEADKTFRMNFDPATLAEF
jgi:Uma2 family endonuclease